jgi:DNA polymerase-1
MVPRIAEMSLRGIPIVRDRLERAYKAVTAEQAARLEALAQYAPIKWHILDEVREVFKATLPGKTTPTGKPSVDLEAMAQCTHPAAPLYRAFSRAGSLIRNFLHPILPLDRLRGLFSLGGAWTGRMSCSDRNLQNVPKDHAHRSIYGDPTRLWIKWDFQAADLVVIASLTNCRAMLGVFARGGDLHKHTAAGMLYRPITSITEKERDIGKTLNFGCCYGGGIPMILERAREFGVDMTPDAARVYQAKFFNLYPEVLAWQRETARKLRAGTPIESAFGRRWIRSADQRGVWNQLLAAPISGTTTDLLLTGLDAAWPLLEQSGVELINLVHDEADFIAPADAWPDIAKTIEAAARTMAEADSRFPMRVEVATGLDWGSTKKQFVVGGGGR